MNFQTYFDKWSGIVKEEKIILPEVKKATEDEIKQVMDTFNNIPQLLIDWWDTANGTKVDVPFLGAFSDEFTPCHFYSIEQSLCFLDYLRNEEDEWGEYPQKTQRDLRIKDGWLNANWLPFAGYNGMSTMVMVDNDPATKGSIGQIIVYQHDPDAIYYVADNITEFYKKSLTLLKENADVFK